ncbi:MAG: DUF1801 domain-containing protein [Flavobacteriaceae bacterium]
MQYQANSPEDYISQIPKERQEAFSKLRDIINKNLPEGFQEGIQYGMFGYYVPHSIYPKGYHCKPSDPLPFMGIASQKNSINFYHMGIYAIPELYNWFVAEYPKYSKRKLNMGKSCVRFKYLNDIPYQLLGELATKLSVQQWIAVYESNFKKK